MTTDTANTPTREHWHDLGDISRMIVAYGDVAQSTSSPCTSPSCARRLFLLAEGVSDDQAFLEEEEREDTSPFIVTIREGVVVEQAWLVQASGPEAAYEHGILRNGENISETIVDSEWDEIRSVERVRPGETPEFNMDAGTMLRVFAQVIVDHGMEGQGADAVRGMEHVLAGEWSEAQALARAAQSGS